MLYIAFWIILIAAIIGVSLWYLKSKKKGVKGEEESVPPVKPEIPTEAPSAAPPTTEAPSEGEQTPPGQMPPQTPPQM